MNVFHIFRCVRYYVSPQSPANFPGKYNDFPRLRENGVDFTQSMRKPEIVAETAWMDSLGIFAGTRFRVPVRLSVRGSRGTQ